MHPDDSLERPEGDHGSPAADNAAPVNAWPALRQALIRVSRSGTWVLASDGLSGPYPASESRPTGNGMEIVLESTDASIGVEMDEAYGVLSMSVPMGPDASEWVTADESWGCYPVLRARACRRPSLFRPGAPRVRSGAPVAGSVRLTNPVPPGALLRTRSPALAADHGLQEHRSAPGGGERKCQAPGRAFLQAAERDTAGASAHQ